MLFCFAVKSSQAFLLSWLDAVSRMNEKYRKPMLVDCLAMRKQHVDMPTKKDT